MNAPRAHILLVGDEILAGEIADANGPFFAEALTAEGYRVTYVGIFPDESDAIAEAVRRALSEADLTVICGGLGPTSDDLTTEAVAKALGRDLVLDEAQWQRIRQIFVALRGSEPPPGNEKQATIPRDAQPLANAHGTAIGYLAEANGRRIAVFPGPPKENRPMFREQLLPKLAGAWATSSGTVTRVFRIFGLAESVVAHRLAELEAEVQHVKVAYQFHFPEILVKLRFERAWAKQAETAAGMLHEALGHHVYAEGNETLPTILGRELAARGETIACAESCTGGMAAMLLTDTPGSSAWFDRGVVTYTNAAKRELLRVPKDLLQAHGAVSEPVAMAMLEGLFERSSATYGFAITGVAGPGGGSGDKPVGTVCIAWGSRQSLEVSTQQFRWDRHYNRVISAWTAMWRVFELVRDYAARA